MELLLGIDIGTSACKTALFDVSGNVIAEAAENYKVYYPAEGYAEQSPDEWWDAVVRALKRLTGSDKFDRNDIRAVGIDGQSWSAIPVSKDGRVIVNTPIWFDTRSAGICRSLEEKYGEGAFFDICGNPVKPTYSMPKILWFRENYPEVYEKAEYFLQSNSFIVMKLTGKISQDHSQGYGYFCYDIKNLRWDKDVCREVGVDPGKLPELYECSDIVGRVTHEAALITGLPEGIPVAAGGLDAACGTLGAGVCEAGETQEQGGTSGGMSICTEKPLADKRLILGRHVVPERWLLQGGTVGGGSTVKWLASEFGLAEKELGDRNSTSVFREMDAAAEKIPIGSDGMIFLPYMAGERSPIWNEKAKGVFYGIDFSKTRAHFYRAGMEGAVFALLHNIRTAEEAGVFADTLVSIGGAAGSRFWTQMKADVCNKVIKVASADTATALGAAILAGVGAGIYTDCASACGKCVVTKKTYYPNEENHEKYMKVYPRYLELYRRLEAMMS